MNPSLHRNVYPLLALSLIGMWTVSPGYAAEALAPVASLPGIDNVGASDGGTAEFIPTSKGAEPLLATTGSDQTVHLWQWREGKLLRDLPGLSAPARQLVASPDGKTLAATGWNYADGSVRDPQVRVWSLPNGETKTFAAPDVELRRIAFWPDAQTLAVQGRQKATLNSEAVVLLYDVATGTLLKSLTNHYALAFNAREKTLLESRYNRRTGRDLPGVARWNVTTGDFDAALWPVTAEQMARGFLPAVGDGEFSSDGTRAAVLQHEDTSVAPVSRTVRIFQTAPLRPLFSLSPVQSGFQSTFGKVRFAGRFLLTQEIGGASLWDAQAGDLLATLPQVAGVLAVSPDGRFLAARPAIPQTVKGYEAAPKAPTGVQVWDLSGFKPLGENKAAPLVADTDGARQMLAPDIHLGAVSSLAFSPDGTTLVAGSGNLLLSFDTQSGARLHTRSGTGSSASLTVSPDGRWVLTGGRGDDNTPRLWDARTLLPVCNLGQLEIGIDGVTFSSDSRLALAASTGQISIWETATGKKLKSLPNSNNIYRAATPVFSPDGKLLASGDGGSGIALWSVTKIVTSPTSSLDTPDRTLQGNGNGHNSLAFSPDSKTLFGGARDGDIEVFDVVTGKVLRSWRTGDDAKLRTMRLSPDGKDLVTVSGADAYEKPQLPEGIIKVWDAATGKLERTIKTTGIAAHSAAFGTTPQGLTLSVGLADGSIKLWHLN